MDRKGNRKVRRLPDEYFLFKLRAVEHITEQAGGQDRSSEKPDHHRRIVFRVHLHVRPVGDGVLRACRNASPRRSRAGHTFPDA